MLDFSIDWLQAFSMLGRVALAAVLAGIIGYEREHVQRNAGMRTHILVAIGAALVMCSGEFLMYQFPNSSIDPARIGAQVVSGIGFLCAGTIIKEGISVRGLTTASSLWCVSCVGLAAGCGNYVLAAATTALILIVLRVLRSMAHSRRGKAKRLVLQVMLSMSGQSIVHLQKDLERMGCVIDEFSFAIDNKNLRRHVYAHLTLPDRDDLAKMMEELSRIDGVESVESVYE
ncbi:MAG: MgtC/SapB family protein [Eubacteriales bacterium]